MSEILRCAQTVTPFSFIWDCFDPLKETRAGWLSPCLSPSAHSSRFLSSFSQPFPHSTISIVWICRSCCSSLWIRSGLRLCSRWIRISHQLLGSLPVFLLQPLLPFTLRLRGQLMLSLQGPHQPMRLFQDQWYSFCHRMSWRYLWSPKHHGRLACRKCSEPSSRILSRSSPCFYAKIQIFLLHIVTWPCYWVHCWSCAFWLGWGFPHGVRYACRVRPCYHAN